MERSITQNISIQSRVQPNSPRRIVMADQLKPIRVKSWLKDHMIYGGKSNKKNSAGKCMIHYWDTFVVTLLFRKDMVDNVGKAMLRFAEEVKIIIALGDV